MITTRGRKPELRSCSKCGKDHPTTLFNANGFCVYFASASVMEDTPKILDAKAEKMGDDAMAARRREYLKLQAQMNRSLNKLKRQAEQNEEQAKELDAVEAAKQELSRRELAKKHLLPSIMRFNETYEPGRVHKDTCDKLEWLSAARHLYIKISILLG